MQRWRAGGGEIYARCEEKLKQATKGRNGELKGMEADVVQSSTTGLVFIQI